MMTHDWKRNTDGVVPSRHMIFAEIESIAQEYVKGYPSVWSQFSSTSLVDHFVSISAGCLTPMFVADWVKCDAEYATRAARKWGVYGDSPLIENSVIRAAQQRLRSVAESGNCTGQYLWGKLVHTSSSDTKNDGVDLLISPFTESFDGCWRLNNGDVKVSSAARDKAGLHYITSAARGGHAYAMTHLGKLCNDFDNTAEAIGWWDKALAIAAVPEAAYNIGVCFGLGHNGTKQNVDTAIRYYTHAVVIALEGGGTVLDATDNALGQECHPVTTVSGFISFLACDAQIEFLRLAKQNASLILANEAQGKRTKQRNGHDPASGCAQQ